MRALLLLLPLCRAAAVPTAWLDGGAAPADAPVRLTLALKQRNLAELERRFWAVSDPGSDSYGSHLSLPQIAEVVAPAPAAADAVRRWAARLGASELHDHATRDYLSLTLPAAAVAAAFAATDLRVYRHGDGTELTRALGGHTIPRELAGIVELVFPLSDPLPKPTPHKQRRRDGAPRAPPTTAGSAWPSDCTGTFDTHFPITPEAVYQTYNITPEMRARSLGSVAVAGSPASEDQFSPLDLAEFTSRCSLPPLNFTDLGNGKIPNRTKCHAIPNYDCGEGTLDGKCSSFQSSAEASFKQRLVHGQSRTSTWWRRKSRCRCGR